MASNAERLRAAFDSRDLHQLVALLDEQVVWRGIPGWDYGRESRPDSLEADGRRLEPDEHEEDRDNGHEHAPICTSREDVRAVLEGFLATGTTGQPAVVSGSGDSLVVDPGVEPALPFPLHLGFTFRGGRIVLIQDYPDRATALADLKG